MLVNITRVFLSFRHPYDLILGRPSNHELLHGWKVETTTPTMPTINLSSSRLSALLVFQTGIAGNLARRTVPPIWITANLSSVRPDRFSVHRRQTSRAERTERLWSQSRNWSLLASFWTSKCIVFSNRSFPVQICRRPPTRTVLGSWTN